MQESEITPEIARQEKLQPNDKIAKKPTNGTAPKKGVTPVLKTTRPSKKKGRKEPCFDAP